MLGLKLFGAAIKFVMVTVISGTSGSVTVNPYPSFEICQTDLELAPTVPGLTGRACMKISDYEDAVKSGRPLPVFKTAKQRSDETNQANVNYEVQQQRYEQQLAEFKKAAADAAKLQQQVEASQKKYDEQLRAAHKMNSKK